MAGESSGRKAFQEDIFAEDNEKWSWPRNILNAKAATSGSNYLPVSSGAKVESTDSSSSDEELGFRGDSNSQKRSFRKRESSSASEGNQLEDASSSPGASGVLPHERVLLSMYDDDARSGSPSGTYKNTDLAFTSSFRKEINPLSCKSPERDAFQSTSLAKTEKFHYERESNLGRRNSKDISPVPHNESPKRGYKTESSKKSPESHRPRLQRSRSREKKFCHRSRTRSHSRSKERRIKSPHRAKHRSRSGEHSLSRDRRSRSRSRDRNSDRKHHSRSRRSRSKDSRRRSSSRHRRSRSRSYDRRRGSRYRSSSRDRYRRRYSRSRSRSRDRSRGRSGSRNRKPGSLPLSTAGGAMTPQMALQQTMAAMSAKAQALTGIALPKYYNPAAVNPLKYAEQVQKRKLLWQTKEKVEEQPKNSVWDKLTFAQDQDGKMTAKFRKLMGIKTESPPEKEPPEGEDKESFLKKQEELFRDLDQQYEMARMTTHTQRGVGLGYSAQALYPPVQK